MNVRLLWDRIESRLDSSLPGWRNRIEELGQVAAVEARSRGRTWSDDAVFKAVSMAVLSSNTDWSKIERVQVELAELFAGFRLETYAALPASEIGDRFLPWFKKRKVGSMTLERDLVNLVGATRILLQYSRDHGMADGYFTSLMHRCEGDPKQAALRLGREGEYKLPSLGVALAAEALKNLGFDVAKPDRHIMRAVGSFGLVRFGRWAGGGGGRNGRAPPVTTSKSKLLAVMTAVEEVAESAGKPVVLVDNAIRLLSTRSGPYLTNSELAEVSREGDLPEGQAGSLAALFRSWKTEGDAEEQRETLEYLIRALDGGRPPDRKLFPQELKGKTW